MAFTRETEVGQSNLIKLAEILNQPSNSPAWKKLMQIVPYQLTHNEQLNDGRPKYSDQDIRSIEKAAAVNRLNNAAQIFLHEWITSGKIRPTLSHLLQLLVKSESFRAADYVAIDLLSEAPPRRPERGPAAKIDISLPDEHNGIDDELLNGNYPNTSRTTNESVARVSALTTSRPQNFVPHSEFFGGANDSGLQQNSGDIPNVSVFNVGAMSTNGTNHQRDNDTDSVTPRMNSTGEEKCLTGNVTQHNNQTVTPAERTITHNFVPKFFSNYKSSGDSTALMHTQRSDANIPNLSTLNITDGNDNGNSNNDLNATESLIGRFCHNYCRQRWLIERRD